MSLLEFLVIILKFWYISIPALFFIIPILVRVFNSISGRASFEEEKKALAKKETEITSLKNSLILREQSLDKRENDLNESRHSFNDKLRLRAIELARDIASRSYISDTPAFHALRLSNPLTDNKLIGIMTGESRIEPPFDISAIIASDSGSSYQTTLWHCSCPDYQFRGSPCKHMMRLAIEMGVLLNSSRLASEYISALISKKEEIEQDIKSSLLHEEAKKAQIEQEIERLLLLEEEKKDDISKLKFELSPIFQEEQQTFPWLSGLLAEYEALRDKEREDKIRGPLVSDARNERRRLAEEKKSLLYTNKLLEHQLLTYESLFPWLEEFKELTPAEAAAAVNSYATDTESEYVLLHPWLSPDEYAHKSDSEKYQLAFDRWKKRKRSNWEAGIDYERYIGYLYELEGYRVVYSGAIQGKEDMGRDLIASRGSVSLVIQCKRYSSQKQVHENTVFQLYGSGILYSLDKASNGHKICSVIYTTSTLSEIASACAERLFITVYENYKLADYPMIKCNISKNGECIYHLPFDQQYDKVRIRPKSGELYVSTVKEAEDAGFRRAKKWTGGSQ